MHVLFSNDIKDQIAKELKNTTDSLQVITAYCKKDAFMFMQKSINKSIKNKRIMVRFTYDDIISGASDINIYEVSKKYGWKMYVRFDMHAKTYIFDKKRCIIGSSNLTPSGLELRPNANYEIATICDIDDDDIARIDSLFNNAILMNDVIYTRMLGCLASDDSSITSIRKNWTDDILSLFIPDIPALFTYDFPQSLSPLNMEIDTLRFLNLPANSSIEDIRIAFRWSKPYQWICSVLKNSPNQEIFFGALSEKLHNILVNDPKPYRKEVKMIQQYLLNWIEELGMEHITIDRSSHSQRIKYNN